MRFRNVAERGEVVFLTTTVIGFVPVFRRRVVAETFLLGLFEDCRFHGLALYAYVVMPEHVHLLLRPPPSLSPSQVMNRLKSAAAHRCLPLLSDIERTKIAADPQAKHRGFWQRSFRSFAVSREEVFVPKFEYIHDNAVRRGLCPRAEDYAYSSARFYAELPVPGTEESGLDTLHLESHFPHGLRFSLRLRSHL